MQTHTGGWNNTMAAAIGNTYRVSGRSRGCVSMLGWIDQEGVLVIDQEDGTARSPLLLAIPIVLVVDQEGVLVC